MPTIWPVCSTTYRTTEWIQEEVVMTPISIAVIVGSLHRDFVQGWMDHGVAWLRTHLAMATT